jgi:hypothetical protein
MGKPNQKQDYSVFCVWDLLSYLLDRLVAVDYSVLHTNLVSQCYHVVHIS